MYNDTYEEFQKEYRVFCGTKGLCLDHLPVNLRHLYALACKHSDLTRDTPLGTWDGVSKSVTAGFLPGQTLREQYCLYLEGFNAYAACVNNNAVSSSSPESLPKQQASSPQQLRPFRLTQSPETAGADQKPRTKLPAKHHKLVQELQRRRGIAAVMPPACPPAMPPPAALVTSQQHTCLPDSRSDSESPAAKPSKTLGELVFTAHKQALATLPAQAASAEPVRAGRQVKKAIRSAGRLVQSAAQPARPAAAAAPPPPPRLPPGRRSRRVHNRVRPAGFVDSSMIVTESSSSSSESDEGSTSDNSDSDKSDSATGSKCPWKLGPDYQAALPELQQLPQGGLPPAEAKYLRPPVFTPAAPGASSSSGSRPFTGDTLAPGVFRKMWGQAASGPARVQLLEGWLNKMDQHMGQQLAQSLGLSRLGSKLRSTWAPHEEILFALGMLDKYRKFRHIRRCYLPRRSVHQLNSYYYNVWKNRAGPVPEEYAALNENPYGDGPAWRRQLCERLAAMWDHESMGPIPTSAQQDPTAVAGAAAAASAAAAKQQAVTAAIAGIRSVAAAKASFVKNLSDGRESSGRKLAGAAASAQAVVAVKVPLTATQGAAGGLCAAVTISAGIAGTEAGQQQTTNSGAGGAASAAAIAAGIIARLTATAAASGSLTKPSAAAQARAAAGARQQFVSGIRGSGGVHRGGGNTAAITVPAGLSGMKQATASTNGCRPGTVNTVQQPAGQVIGLRDRATQQASAGVPRQKVQESQPVARHSLQAAPQAPQDVAHDVRRRLAQPQAQEIATAAVEGRVHQPRQHQQKVSSPGDASPQQSTGTQRSSSSESNSAAGSPSGPSSSRSCSGSQSPSDGGSDTSSGSDSQQQPDNGNDPKLQSDAGTSGSPSAGPSSDGADCSSRGGDAVAGPAASMLLNRTGPEQLHSGASDASGRDTGNTSTSSDSSESTSSSDSGASSHSSSDNTSDDETSECVSRGKRLAVQKSCPDGSPSVVTLTSCGSDHEYGCPPDDQHRRQKVAVSRKRRRSGSRESGVTGGSVACLEDSDGVICLSA